MMQLLLTTRAHTGLRTAARLLPLHPAARLWALLRLRRCCWFRLLR
jgi:hypothetical protein